MGEHVLVVGAMLLDTKGKPTAGLQPGTSNPAEIRHVRGGGARNVAENLARLGADVLLISAVGDDRTGKRLMAQTAEAGVDLEHVMTVQGSNTGSYIAILDADGSLSVAMDDVRVVEHVSAGYLYKNRRLFRDACMVMADGSLTSPALETLTRLCRQYELPFVADPSSVRLAHKLRPHLADLNLVVPNEIEAAALAGVDFSGYGSDASMDKALLLRQAGVELAIVTMSDFGIVYATSDETGHIPARYSQMVDSTGTGDAVTAAIMFGLINDLPAIEAIRLGAAAASLTLQSNDTVVPDLSLDMLYDHLIV
jgi:pseudouridine kinase